METGNQHPMEDYFDFLSPDDIRIKGTRVGIETVDDFMETRNQPEQQVREGLFGMVQK